MQPIWIVLLTILKGSYFIMFNLNFTVLKAPEKIRSEFEKALNSYHYETPKKIRELRQGQIPSAVNHPISKNDLAELTGVGAQNVGKVEKDFGEAHSLNASIKYLIKIAVIFDMDMNYLVGLTEEPRKLSTLCQRKSPKTKEGLTDNKIDALIDLQQKMLDVLQGS